MEKFDTLPVETVSQKVCFFVSSTTHLYEIVNIDKKVKEYGW